MPERIRKLSIDGFRGATRPIVLDLDATKPVTLIFGENASGKSTLVDALECVAVGTTSFIDYWKLGQGKRKESYIPSLGREMKDVGIEIEVDGRSYRAALDAKGVSVCNTPGRPVVKVLRRKSLQAFIEADPAVRYREVARFLDIPEIEAAEETLREAMKNAKKVVDSAASAVAQARESLQGQWEEEGSPGADGNQDCAERWARDQAKIDPAALRAAQRMLQRRISAIEQLQSSAVAEQNGGKQLAAAGSTLEHANAALKEVEQGAEKRNVNLVMLLQDARNYLTETPDDVCPVCETTPIVAADLVARLDTRLREVGDLKRSGDAVRSATRQYHDARQQYEDAKATLLASAKAAIGTLEAIPQGYETFDELTQTDPERALALAQQLHGNIGGPRDAAQAQLEATQKSIHTLSGIVRSINTLDQKTEEAMQKADLSKKLESALKLFEAERKAYVEQVLADIGGAVDALYQQIHPGEKLGGLKLKLDERKRSSLLYGVAFGAKDDVHPQPYYSESHLDTLGLCIFLALAKRASKDCIVVLDDVFVSVDQQHLHRSVDMLLNEVQSLGQLIVTTHYRPLRNRFANSRTGSSDVCLIDLHTWTMDEGIRHASPRLELDTLEHALATLPLQREDVATTSGRLLENAFDHNALLYGLRMPRKPEPRYTLGELYSAVRQVKNWQTSHGNHSTEIKPLLAALQPVLPVRNEAGAHYNENGELLADADIVAFGKAALAVLKSLICPDCRGMAEKQDNQQGDWKCRCGNTRMLPYEI